MSITGKQIRIYQASTGAMRVRFDEQKETVMLTQQQVGELFGVQKAAISKHVSNIFKSGELKKNATVSILETVQIEGGRKTKRKMTYYNLDLILSVGYRVNSIRATKFRQWVTKTLRSHIIGGYTLNPAVIKNNYSDFLKAVNGIKKLLPSGDQVTTSNVLELVKTFAETWLSLEAYDKQNLPSSGKLKRKLRISPDELSKALGGLKGNLMAKKEASELFGASRAANIGIKNIVGSIYQTFDGRDVYPTIEEKAAHLLYFIVKNHPFVDGNKRSGAFSFVWFLNKARVLDVTRLSPEALTALTLLVAESKPTEKERMVGLILLLIKRK